MCDLIDATEQAVALCEEAEAAVTNDGKVGATADKFNAFFGATTNFASVQALVRLCSESANNESLAHLFLSRMTKANLLALWQMKADRRRKL